MVSKGESFDANADGTFVAGQVVGEMGMGTAGMGKGGSGTAGEELWRLRPPAGSTPGNALNPRS